ncbi:MAG TPA: CAP domain-containing protein [Caulobacteraceae bacterium]|nr:CAP domain-containing protein [Caulobacteraceae bacterium]
MIVDRRSALFGVGAAALAGSAQGAPTDRWMAYERRLHERAADAAGGRFDAAFEEALLGLTLSFRAEQGSAPVAVDPALTLAARAHAADMAAGKFFEHDTPDGFTTLDRTGLLVRKMMGVFGENLAYQTGAAGVVTPRNCFQGWQARPGHRANLLRPDFTHVGHGVVRLRDHWYSAAVFGGKAAWLDEDLPLHADGAAINATLINAHPNLPAYFVSDPKRDPTGDAFPTPGLGPRLAPGAYRIRPLKLKAGRAFNVLWGPIVLI